MLFRQAKDALFYTSLCLFLYYETFYDVGPGVLILKFDTVAWLLQLNYNVQSLTDWQDKSFVICNKYSKALKVFFMEMQLRKIYNFNNTINNINTKQ